MIDDVLESQDALTQLFCLNHEFGEEWHAFVAAATNASRRLTLEVTPEHFPYWVKPLGMDDAFAVLDVAKRKLAVAPAAIELTGDAATGWTLDIDSSSPAFAFLNKHGGRRST